MSNRVRKKVKQQNPSIILVERVILGFSEYEKHHFLRSNNPFFSIVLTKKG